MAFSASRRSGGGLKDAHKDAEETGVFAWNVTHEALAVCAICDPPMCFVIAFAPSS